MPKLTEQQIVRVHKLAREGKQIREIASMVGAHRNTITAHLKLRCAYSAATISKLAIRVSLPPTRQISIYDAAIYLPGWPSPSRVNKLRQAGVLEVKTSDRRTVAKSRYWWNSVNQPFTTEQLIARAARKMLPKGVWFRTDLLLNYLSSSEVNQVFQLSDEMEDCKFWPCRRYRFVPATSIYRIGLEPNVPLSVMSRVCECLRISGVATL